MVSAADLLAALRHDGHTVDLTPARKVRVTPPLADIEHRCAMAAHRTAVVAALDDERFCHRCRLPAPRLVLAYWSTSERYCPACCDTIAADMDRQRSWPTPPWTLKDLAALDAEARNVA